MSAGKQDQNDLTVGPYFLFLVLFSLFVPFFFFSFFDRIMGRGKGRIHIEKELRKLYQCLHGDWICWL